MSFDDDALGANAISLRKNLLLKIVTVEVAGHVLIEIQ